MYYLLLPQYISVSAEYADVWHIKVLYHVILDQNKYLETLI